MSATSNKILHDFTQGPILWPMAKFSIPFMLSNALQVLYTTVDMWIVGNFIEDGHIALASVTNASRVVDFLLIIGLGFATSGQIYVAQLIGQKRHQELNKAIGTFFSFFLLIGAEMSIIGLCDAEVIPDIINTPGPAKHGAIQYITICSAGLFFHYGYNMISAVLRGMGDSKHPLLFIAIASCTNIVFDYILIAPFASAPHTTGILHYIDFLLASLLRGDFQIGVAGAAIATVLGQAVSFIFAACFLYRRRNDFKFDFAISSFKIDNEILGALIKLGIPFAIRFSAVNLSMIYVVKLINGAGATEAECLAATTVFGVGSKMDDIVTKVTQGIMQAATGMIGQNYGACEYKRVRKVVHYAWLLSFGFYVVYSVFLLGYPEKMFSIFNDNEEVLKLAPLFAKNIVWQFPGLTLTRGTNGFVNGIGNANFALIIGILDGVVLRIGCSWFFGSFLGMGLGGYILGFAIACYGLCIPSLIYFYFFPWEKRKAVTV